MTRKPASRRPKASKKKVIVGVQVSDPTPKQLAALKKIFRSKALATLGALPTRMTITRQWSVAKRRRR